MELTQRQADITRTVAAMIDMAANERCSHRDGVNLLVRDEDPMYVVDATRTILLGLVFLATAHDVEDHRVVVEARAKLGQPAVQPATHDEIELHLDTAHRAAHFICAMNFAAFGVDYAREKSRDIVSRFAAGNFGPGVQVGD